MNTVPSAALYAIDPYLERLSRLLRSIVAGLIAFYWGAFKVWSYIFFGFAAVILVFAGFAELRSHPDRWYSAVSAIAFGIAFLTSSRFRHFVVAAFGFGIVWLVIVTLALAPFFKFASDLDSPLLVTAVLELYALPPLIAAAMLEFARKPRPVLKSKARSKYCGKDKTSLPPQ